jgi:hypothetical protein
MYSSNKEYNASCVTSNYVCPVCHLLLCVCIRLSKHPPEHFATPLQVTRHFVCDIFIIILALQPDSGLGLLCCSNLNFSALLGGEVHIMR